MWRCHRTLKDAVQAGTGHPGDKVTCLGRSSADKRKRRPSRERSCHPSEGSSTAPTPPPLFFHQAPGPGPLTAEARRRCPAAACSCRAGLTPRGPDGLWGLPRCVRRWRKRRRRSRRRRRPSAACRASPPPHGASHGRRRGPPRPLRTWPRSPPPAGR